MKKPGDSNTDVSFGVFVVTVKAGSGWTDMGQ